MTLFSFEYPPGDGGIARLCGEVARRLDEDGTLSGVLTQESSEVSAPRYPAATAVSPHRPSRESRALRHLRGRGDGVLAGVWYPEGLIAWLSRRRPLVILAHGLELRPTRSRWRRGAWAALRRHVLTSADLVVANSHYTAGLVSACAPRARVATVPLGVDPERFAPGDRAAARTRFGIGDERVVTTVSRVHGYKGHDTVLRALAALPPEERAGLLYLVAGRGPAIDSLRELARELGIADQIRWLGFVAEADLPDLYRATDLFVLCTREEPDTPDVEGFGLVFLEAQACGTPVVGARTGGIPDAVEHGRGGWLIEQDDVAALAAHLRRLVAQPEVYARAGADARERVVSGHTWAHYSDRFVDALRNAGLDA